MDQFHYLFVLAACILITLPLEFLLGARVYRRPAAAAIAIGVVIVVFGGWDLIAIARDHWWYSPQYTVGLVLPGQIPIEELLFFIVVPLCALLTYEAVGRLLPTRGERAGHSDGGPR